MIKYYGQDNLWNKEFIWTFGSREIRIHHGQEGTGVAAGVANWELISPITSRKQTEQNQKQVWLFTLKVCHLWYTFSNKTTPLIPTQIVPPLGTKNSNALDSEDLFHVNCYILWPLLTSCCVMPMPEAHMHLNSHTYHTLNKIIN